MNAPSATRPRKPFPYASGTPVEAVQSPLPLLRLDAVSKRYGKGDAGLEVLRGVDMVVREGESVAIVGPSGSGKSTLLNIIGTLDRPTSGAVLLEGENLLAVEDARLAEIRSRKIGFVFQLHHLLPQCTVLENVLVPTLVRRRKAESETSERAVALLRRVGLEPRLDYRPGQLSGGERQRVAVVRALINGPRLLLADEPTGSLDRAGSESLAELLADLNRSEGLTLVVVTHSGALAQRMGKVFELRDGLLNLQHGN